MEHSPAPGTWRRSDGTRVFDTEAMPAWSAAAHTLLVETAGRYHAIITYKDLAAAIQDHTGIATRRQLPNWIGKVLGHVADRCLADREPPLTALCVRQDHTVGPGYSYVLELHGLAVPEDLEAHAARARLDCYHRYASDLPADGGTPALAPRLAAARRKAAAGRARPVHICPRCSMQLPATGVCTECEA